MNILLNNGIHFVKKESGQKICIFAGDFAHEILILSHYNGIL